MQIKKLSPPLMEQWIRVYEQERPKLSANAVSGEALLTYLLAHVHAAPKDDEATEKALFDAVMNNRFFASKLKDGRKPRPKVFLLDDGTTVGIDLETGYFSVDGNYRLRDELTYVKGLDDADLDNVLRTVDWLRCKRLYEKKTER